MFKYLLILALGVALGYSYGWKDAQVNEKHIAERMLAHLTADAAMDTQPMREAVRA